MIYQAVLAAEQANSAEQALGVALVVGLIVVGIALLVLFISALISVLSSRVLTGGGKVLWILVVFAFPFLGPLGWFIWGRKQPSYRSGQPIQEVS
ncbi:PLD nuclease N-terminal domain-containing protein [Psychromicrobium lacuslunae]|uniref:PLD nuclease N-terminal domain-containing protein n=1 Tax=Psychromicrobium lacuslunae TaxID=1618207 RepID=UPI0005D42F42|nr:PLD nuclease N-terminal domain-containing protein [Psychromicrobium lacuslunae]